MAKKIITMITVVIATCSFFVGCTNNNSVELSGDNTSNHTSIETDIKEELTKNTEAIYVYVNGQVKYPGVYKLQAGDRAYQAVKKAGGLTKKAAKNNINLAETVVDAQNIYVMSKKEYNDSVSDTNNNNTDEKDQKSDSTATNNLININTASEKDLTQLPGIGESKAAAIIKYREDNGNFSSKEDIKNVSGIGDSTYSNIEDLITV